MVVGHASIYVSILRIFLNIPNTKKLASPPLSKVVETIQLTFQILFCTDVCMKSTNQYWIPVFNFRKNSLITLFHPNIPSRRISTSHRRIKNAPSIDKTGNLLSLPKVQKIFLILSETR